MRHRHFIWLAAGAAFAVLAVLPPAIARTRKVDVAIVLAADVSRSIDEEEFQLQRQGYAVALTSPQFLHAIRAGVQGDVALCFVEWAGVGQQAVVAKWMVVRDGEGAAEFAKTLLNAPRSFEGRTAIGDAVNFAVVQLEASGITATRRIIDVSGDGNSNSGWPVDAARDDTIAKGIIINGLAIINEKTGRLPGNLFYFHTHPPGGLPKYYRENVIGGPGSFVMQVVNFDTFADAMTNKLVTEISDASPHIHADGLHHLRLPRAQGRQRW
jgi:Protein of unknown function (DUF1194)